MIKWLGTTYRFHPLFTLVILASAASGYFLEVATLFTIVLIHEMGHVAAAKSFGWKVKEIKLLPFGGVAVMDDQGKGSAFEEIVVALAGPLQNAIMIGVSFVFRKSGIWSDDWADYFLKSNMIIALFNLLPVLPLDGGKILQSAMSQWFNYYRVLMIGACTGIVSSILVIVAAFIAWGSPGIQLNVLIIGIFLLYSNIFELKHLPFVFMRFLVKRQAGLPGMLKRGMESRFIAVPEERRIMLTVRLLNRKNYHFFYVLNETGEVRGIFSEQRLLMKYFTDCKPNSAVSELFM